MAHPDDLLTTTAVALILGVSTKAVGNWCDEGLMDCERTAGNHRRLYMRNVLAFATDRAMPVNLRKLSDVKKRVRPLA